MHACKRVRDVMVTDLVTVERGDDATLALAAMNESRIRHVPVVEAGRLVGLVTSTDLLRERVSSGEKTAVGKVMAPEPCTVRPDAPVREAVELLLEGRFGCVPVVKADGTLAGMVTNVDLLLYLRDLLHDLEEWTGETPENPGGAAGRGREVA